MTEPQSIAAILSVPDCEAPEAVALHFEGVDHTYGSVRSDASQVAARLRAMGVSRGDRVALLFPNHAHFVCAFFGVSMLGAVVVPINPLFKFEEISHIVADSGSKVIVVHERYVPEVSKALAERSLTDSSATKILRFVYSDSPEPSDEASDFILSAGTGQSNSYVVTPVDLDLDLAVIVYTSGTTGKPKGAMLSQRNLLAGVRIAENFLNVYPSDRTLAMLPLCHIYGLTLVMLAMLRRGSRVIIHEKFDPAVALESIETHAITLLPAVPSMYQFMMMENEKQKRDLSSLRVSMSGAASMPLALFTKLKEMLPCPILEGYGLTEVSCIATVTPMDGEQKIGSVGPGFPGVEISIFDRETRTHQLPAGPENIGEVAVRGPNVMKGYYKREAETADCMRGDWFLTGDLGYLDQDSYLFLVGRTKELIIRGGQNIYPREIEEVIQRLPAVAEVAVIGVPDSFMGERVKAFVSLKPNTSLSEDSIKEFCGQHLADYKVPRLIEFIAALPRNATGKVLKRVLQTK